MQPKEYIYTKCTTCGRTECPMKEIVQKPDWDKALIAVLRKDPQHEGKTDDDVLTFFAEMEGWIP